MKLTLGHTQRGALALSLALPLLLGGCDRRDVEDDAQPTPAEDTVSREAGTPTTQPSSPATAAAPEMPVVDAAPAAAGSQADALALLVALNEHEIAAADQAVGKNVTGKVREFADMMKVDHARNLADTTKLGAAVSTAPAVTAMKAKGEADLRALGGNSGAAYERAYMDAMVQGHADALALIDGTLLPAATDAKVRDHFTATRGAVAAHLERAKEIRAALK